MIEVSVRNVNDPMPTGQGDKGKYRIHLRLYNINNFFTFHSFVVGSLLKWISSRLNTRFLKPISIIESTCKHDVWAAYHFESSNNLK